MTRQTKQHLLLIFLAIVIIALLSGCSGKNTYQYNDKDTGSLVLYAFWGEGCSHCEEAKPFLKELDDTYLSLRIRGFEIWYDKDNADLFTQMADHYNVPAGGRGTPTFFLGNRYWTGFSDTIAQDIKATVDLCNQSSCPDAGAGIVPGATGELSTPGPVAENTADVIDVPLIGKVDLTKQSVWISTLLIAFVDGVNPCSIWVLTMLLAITLHTGSRKKVAIIGIIFLTVTAIIYALFIAGLFTVLSVVSYISWIQVVVAIVALFFGLVNLKDYFWYKEGLSFTISDKKKPGLFQKMRNLMDARQSIWALSGATVVMAAGVSLVEFSCTAGFPVLWTNLLISQDVSRNLFIALLIFYMLIYQLDELAIYFASVFTLKATRMEEKHGRILKLIGGSLMLVLAAVMLINPNWMNSLGRSLLIFTFAFGLVGLILLLHRRILPAFGIWIGSEARGKARIKKKTKVRAKRH
jgi:cytochrome c biogenesis protein CcdA/thiol-disulfide isomerase/thioredoxin